MADVNGWIMPDLLGSYIRGRSIADQDAERKRLLAQDEQLRAMGPQALPDAPDLQQVWSANPALATRLYENRQSFDLRQAMLEARDAAKAAVSSTESPFGKVNPGDYEPESLARFQQTGNFADLRRVWAPQQAWIGQMAGGIAAVPRTPGGVGSPQMLSAPDQEVAAAVQAATATEGAKTTARADAERMAAMQKKLSDNASAADLLEIADPLLDVATGSAAGAAADKVANFFGFSPTGDQAIGALQVLQAGLMLQMPRMEGPQSDRDVQLYRQAAADLGDPTIPRARKKQAVATIRAIQGKYGERVGALVPPKPGDVRKGYRFKGGNPRDRNNWEPVK